MVTACDGGDEAFDELRNHTSETAQDEEEAEGADEPEPTSGTGAGAGGSCGANGQRRPRGDAEEFIWSGEGPGGANDDEDFGGGGGAPNLERPLLDVISNKEARKKRKQEAKRPRGNVYTHTLPKNLQNALRSDTKALGAG